LFVAAFGLGAYAKAQCANPANAIVAENCLPGSPSSEWDTKTFEGDSTIQGFATDMSVNRGSTISFKIKSTASAYRIDIYRMGYYGGMGARKVATITPSVSLPQSQPTCITDATVGLMDCGNWAVSASWAVPATATSGIYFAHLVRTDTGGSSHIIFIVRDDSSHSAVLFQTADETWQAYNYYGAGSVYSQASPIWDLNGRSFKVSYNRPFLTRNFQQESDTFVFGAEFAMVQWLEQNGYDITYFTGVDAARYGSLMLNHKIYMDTGHDEYWSAQHRANVEAARDAGVNLAFFGGNQAFWKTRWENSIDGSNTQYRTLVCYKETLAFAKIDPTSTWTGTWRDPLLSPPSDGGRPENSLLGTLFMVNGTSADNDGSMKIQVPAEDGKMRFWRNTAAASLAAGTTYNLPTGTLGYEWDSDIDNGSRPAGLFHLSTSTHNLTSDLLLDQGATYGAGTATHNMTMYRAASGALVFSSGSIDWSWALNNNHDNPFSFDLTDPDPAAQQATVNLFADMGVQPATLQPGLVPATASTDTAPPASTISYPTAAMTLNTGSSITVTGTATDGGGRVGAVEVSGDGGTTWHPANGRSNWSYTWIPSQVGSVTLLSRAVDDSGNLETPHGITLTVSPQVCPCNIWRAATPQSADSGDGNAVELGLKFRADADGSILGVRFYKAAANTGAHVGHLWTESGALLGTVTFSGESSSGWQQANFSSPIAVTANTTYVVSYFAPNGHYSVDGEYFIQSGVDNPPLHALADGVDGSNAVFTYGSNGGFPTSTYRGGNYWVDVVFTSSNTYKVTGTIQGPGGAGANVALSGPVMLSTTADASGNYSFDGLVNGTYTITPSNSGVTFTPQSAQVTVNYASLSGVNFSAVVTNPQTISGTITGTAGAGATVNLTGAAIATTAVDASGNYAFTGLLNGSYTVAPQAPAVIFTPASKSVVLSGAGSSGVDFSAQTCNCISIWPSTATPSVIDANDATPVEVGVNFTSSLPGMVYGIRFYKASTNTGTHVGHLWSSSGTLLATATFTNESTSGWQQVTFSTPITITPNVTYVASYFAPAGHYSADSNYFATNGASAPPLQAPAGTSSVPNGVYLYTTSGGFPVQSYASTNYWVDVLFASDQAHSISGTLSGPGSAGAVVNISGSLGTATVTADASGYYSAASLTPGTYTVSASNTNAAFTPAMQSVTIGSGDVTGLNFVGSSLCPCNSIWQPTAVPGTVDAGDGKGVETGVRFTADYDGYILGVRFYKAPANTGTHTANLWTGDGSAALLATSALPAETGSGWQQVMFTSPVPVTANTSYVASYYAPQGHYSVTGAQFANAGVDAPPLHASLGTSDQPNGVFAYGSTSLYPDSSYNATNYWVDVVYAKATSFSLGGVLTGSGGAGRTVTISGPGGMQSATADSSGNYRFDGLAPGTYTVTPVASGVVTFSPASQNVTISANHVLGVNFASVQPTYAISGTITGGPGDTVNLSGPVTATTTADASGNYSFTGLYSGTYTVTPGTGGFVVSPSSQSVTVSGADVAAVNFTATGVQYSISGVIAGGAGSTVTLEGPTTLSTTADASGNYSFAGLASGSYLVTPAKQGAVFTPASASITVYNASVSGADFAVPPNCPCNTIWQPSSKPANVDPNDTHASEVGVTFRVDADGYLAGIRFYKGPLNTGTHTGNLWSSTGTLLATATFVNESTTGWQQVLFANPVPVKANTSYVASYFAPQGHYSGDPQSFANGGVDAPPLHALQDGVSGANGLYLYTTVSAFPTSTFGSANYWTDVVYTPTSTYTVTGSISGPGGPNASLVLAGPTTVTATADASGNFSVAGLPNGTYTLTPSAPGMVISPASQSVTINNGHVFGVTFTSQQTYTVSGTLSGAGGANATVTLTGASTASVTANASGAYTVTGLLNGTYTVTPLKTGYAFSPPNQSVTVNNANMTANFGSTALTYTITGTISGAGGPGAAVSLTGTSTATVAANSSGVYSFTVPSGSYTVTPTKTGYIFTPASQVVMVNGADKTANFSSKQTYSISGTISGGGRSGATVKLTGAITATVTSNSSGVYTFTGLPAGSYTVTPTKSGHLMIPTSRSTTISTSNVTGLNFLSL
jgi:hypothetical protein